MFLSLLGVSVQWKVSMHVLTAAIYCLMNSFQITVKLLSDKRKFTPRGF